MPHRDGQSHAHEGKKAHKEQTTESLKYCLRGKLNYTKTRTHGLNGNTRTCIRALHTTRTYMHAYAHTYMHVHA